MSEQRSSEWLSIETMRPPSETEVWLYAKIDDAEIIKKGRISKTKPGEPIVYQWDNTRGPPTHWKPIPARAPDSPEKNAYDVMTPPLGQLCIK